MRIIIPDYEAGSERALGRGRASRRPRGAARLLAGAGRVAGTLAGYAWIYGLLAGAHLLAWADRVRGALAGTPGAARAGEAARPPGTGAASPGADLRSADLRSADLRSADLRSANLPDANLPGADLRIAVGLATAGRPAVAREMLARLARQSRRPDAVIVAVPTSADLGPAPTAGGRVRVLTGARGLTRQRNAILAQAGDADLICFFDDDFVPGDDYLAAVAAAFAADPELAGATGLVVADGITGAGYTVAQAEGLLARGPGRTASDPPGAAPTVYSAYGCNMAFRLSAIRAGRLAFDELLPAYGWLEDVDFSRRVARFGRLARIEGAVGVHLGVKGGRQSGRRFGYSQIANPVYLVGKGSYAWPRAAWLMGRNIAMNLARAATPEPHIDRRGRAAGNARALADLVRGRLHPTRIADLP
ncbi:hypothetical protein OPKNFCMD_6284 [Methylobacterium crusticola]|uniref:Glycosyltransferase 2-like domain-containing protein n=1 Tax=Methylobacterium crusticola TaxID=1697972 RepID=A0ABQ4R777_9HYPH|nr:pentapeptide repeat-containing protein [Methylobacterium crusticola]GJD53508.1 hypothetical protein OPKNFCMD_6284 [Methylobacterium crusticola]